ncbi:putative gag protein [Cucumis melo var. makuwa]|uniref:Gag protein n=1 Tax=Cucumis melo var. makuwa TaxID=1194695 RepID=A0A5D3E5R7_CUCMM|nr:putative gag protein [Cucumis melo var. makuwa]TYK30941.1 putative gag protein [Cucumis melo var. makuwa]
MRGRGRNNLMQPHRVERVHEDRANKIKLNIPPFRGTENAKAYLEWERKIEYIFDCSTFSDNKEMKLAIAEFTSHAGNWSEAKGKFVVAKRMEAESPNTKKNEASKEWKLHQCGKYFSRKRTPTYYSSTSETIQALIVDLEIIDSKGIENKVVDHLSRLSNVSFQCLRDIEDCFVDEQLFYTKGEDP